MKLRWYLVIGLFIGLLSVPFIRKIKGSTYILFEKTAIEFQNYFIVTALVVALLVLWLTWILIRYLLRTSNLTLGWFGGRKSNKARQKTIDGMIALSEGHWKTAETLLSKSAKITDTKLINYLAAAKAAQQQNDLSARDNYLSLAAKSEPDAQIAVGLTQVELQIESKQWENALAGLNHLRNLSPNHPYVLLLLQKSYLALGEWKSLVELLPKLKKHKILAEKELQELEKSIWIKRFKNAESKPLEKLESLWSSLPKPLRHQTNINQSYVETLVKHKQYDKAIQQINQQLKKHWDPVLLKSLFGIKFSDPNAQLSTAESWLKHGKNDTSHYNLLGSLCLQSKLWGKAKSYLEKSLEIQPNPQAYFYLAKAYEQLGHPVSAQEAYENGLSLAVELDEQ